MIELPLPEKFLYDDVGPFQNRWGVYLADEKLNCLKADQIVNTERAWQFWHVHFSELATAKDYVQVSALVPPDSNSPRGDLLSYSQWNTASPSKDFSHQVSPSRCIEHFGRSLSFSERGRVFETKVQAQSSCQPNRYNERTYHVVEILATPFHDQSAPPHVHTPAPRSCKHSKSGVH